MQNKYYYFISSLPYLDYNKEHSIKKHTFLEEARDKLSLADFTHLSEASLAAKRVNNKDPEALKCWNDFNFHLKSQIALIREGRRTQTHHHMPDAVREIFDQPNPLLMESLIQKISWGFLSGQEYKYNFDLNVLIIYYLKLQILERKYTFNNDKGKEAFKELTGVKYGEE